MLKYFQQHWVEIGGAILGLIYLYLEYKADIMLWIVGIAMSLFYVYIFIVEKFYGMACINIYFICAEVYGLYKWKRKKQTGDNSIRRMPTQIIFPFSVVSLALIPTVALLLYLLSSSNVVWMDAFITALNIAALWLLTHKYAEQWLPLIIANAASIFIFYFQQLYPTCLLYAVYTIGAVLGYLRWIRLSKQNVTT